MKVFNLILFFVFSAGFAQTNFAVDTLMLKDAKDLFADDYGNVYLYRSKDFSFTKYDSVGKQKGKLMLTLPFKVQSVQNPLNIPLFSENAQELKFYDQYLNEIQTINFRQKFGQIKMVYAEDLQQIWLLDESMKRLIQYNFREDQMINSFPFNIEFENVSDLLVYDGKVYILKQQSFSAYNYKSEKLFEIAVENAKRLRRENDVIMLITSQSVFQLNSKNLTTLFHDENAKIVDKNSTAYFVSKNNKLYLYPLQKVSDRK